MKQFRLKRIQRAIEYALLVATHLFFVLSFRGFYSWWMAMGLATATFFMNFRLTQLRERRRAAERRNRQRMLADTFESVLFLGFIILLSSTRFLRDWLQVTDQEYLGYIASILAGLFLSGLVGETFWQYRRLPALGLAERENYVANLNRSIIFPYFARRERRVKGEE